MARQRLASPPSPPPRRGTSPTVLVVSGLAVLAAIGAALALSRPAAAAPGPTPTPAPTPAPTPPTGAGTPCSASSSPPQTYVYRLADSGAAETMTSVDVLRTALLIQPAQIKDYDWYVSSSDSTVLTRGQRTTGPDPNSLHGTDRIDVWHAAGAGTATLTGQLLPKIGSGQAIDSFSLTVQVRCA